MSGDRRALRAGGEEVGKDVVKARRACLREAASLLGASDEIARQFATQGETVMEGFPLHVMATGPGNAPWVAWMKLARPDGLGEAAWSVSLQVADNLTMMVEQSAFGLEDDGDGVLLMLLPADLRDAWLLANCLEGMLMMCRSVTAGAVAIRKMTAGAKARA